MPLWSRDDFLAAISGNVRGDVSNHVTGISIDSREINDGDAFFAIQGDNFDGHDFAERAIEAGAAIAICQIGRFEEGSGPFPRLEVVDVLGALEGLGEASRARVKGIVIAVTGSVGKTSTKEALRIAFRTFGEVHASIASFNNHWGVPLSLARMPADVATGIFEVGMNHPGEISPLTKMIRPDIAIITNVEAVHMEAFNNVLGIAAAKAEIFEGLESGGAAILNRDNKYFSYLSEIAEEKSAKIVSFGENKQADIRIEDLILKPDCSVVKARIFETKLTYKINAPGRHMAMNSLAVLAAVHVAGKDLARAALALAEWAPPIGRGSRHEFQLGSETLTLIDESYNANPASMRAAILTLGQSDVTAGGRRIAVLGDMLELGEQSGALHAGLSEAIANAGIDLVFTAGTDMESLYDALPSLLRGGHEVDAAALAKSLPKKIGPGDVVMVKGSNGSRMMDVVAAIESWLRGN
ncbi:MAG: UDP-N-acetylmuramoylalanyl-D-glutamyl-2,6-diaminopimelate--D-alanyl-D-alanine ligase [Rhizobiales bacterium]|nr:UDP-N-acetylmuramoylalanyl-D-glutamyl-2,6-diaminopimelate--D-alanyl-D-alanine ligase [Hyphomicrobiales bacterium]